MNLSHYYKFLRKIERNVDKSKLNVNGINLWPIISIQLGMSVLSVIDGKNENITSFRYRLIKKLETIIKSRLNIFSLISFLVKRDFKNFKKRSFLFLTDTSSKRFLFKKKWYDLYIDSFIDNNKKIESDCYIFESNQRFLKFKKPIRETHYIQNLMIFSFIKSLFIKKPYFSKQFESEYEKIVKLSNNTPYQNFIISKKNLLREWSIIYVLSNYFKKILRIINPKQIYMIHYNGYDGMSMCLAAREMNIESFDIQHGVQGKYHPAYNFNNIPKEGYNLLPNTFLVWSDKEKKMLDQSFKKLKIHKAEVLGNLSLQKFKKQTDVSLHFDKMFLEKINIKNEKKIILISLCWGEVINDDVIKFINITSDEYYFLLRIHPSTTKIEKSKIYMQLSKINTLNFEYEFSSTLPIHSILRNINFHITSVSTVVLEALEFGVKSIVTSFRGKSYYENEINKKQVFFCDSHKKIFQIVKSNLTLSYIEREKV